MLFRYLNRCLTLPNALAISCLLVHHLDQLLNEHFLVDSSIFHYFTQPMLIGVFLVKHNCWQWILKIDLNLEIFSIWAFLKQLLFRRVHKIEFVDLLWHGRDWVGAYCYLHSFQDPQNRLIFIRVYAWDGSDHIKFVIMSRILPNWLLGWRMVLLVRKKNVVE